MELRGTRLGKILVTLDIIDEYQLAAGLGVQHNWGHPLGQALISLGMVDETTIVRALSLQMGAPCIRLGAVEIDPHVREHIPFETALKYRVLPLEIGCASAGETLFVAMNRPWDLEACSALRFLTGMRLSPVLAGDEDLTSAISRCYRGEHTPARCARAAVLSPLN